MAQRRRGGGRTPGCGNTERPLAAGQRRLRETGGTGGAHGGDAGLAAVVTSSPDRGRSAPGGFALWPHSHRRQHRPCGDPPGCGSARRRPVRALRLDSQPGRARPRQGLPQRLPVRRRRAAGDLRGLRQHAGDGWLDAQPSPLWSGSGCEPAGSRLRDVSGCGHRLVR